MNPNQAIVGKAALLGVPSRGKNDLPMVSPLSVDGSFDDDNNDGAAGAGGGDF